MSSKTKATVSKEEAKPALVPKLRFPEFRGAEAWREEALGDLMEITSSKRVHESDWAEAGVPFYRAREIVALNNGEPITPLFISEDLYRENAKRSGEIVAGDLLVSGVRSIGIPYLVKPNDRFYFKDGNIIWLKNRGTKLEGQFLLTLYGTQFVQSQIKMMAGVGTVGTYTIDNANKTVVVFPVDDIEQQKVAECLSSVDELMAAQARKVDALKTHKKGLMQQLFPREGETQPRLRFPESQNAGEWSEEPLDHLAHFQDGFAFKSTDFVKEQDDATQVIRITDINNKNTNEDKVYIPTEFLEQNKLGKYRVDNGDLLLSLTGAAGFNFFFWNGGPAAINQRTAKVTAKKKSGHALLRLLEPLIHEKINERGEGQNNNLSKEFLSTIILRVPDPDEQERIATCLSSLDALITAETQKLEALKTHKKGLMQQLFPAPTEQPHTSEGQGPGLFPSPEEAIDS